MGGRGGRRGARLLPGGRAGQQLQQPGLLVFLERHTERRPSGLVLPEALVVSEGVGPCQETLNTAP